MTPTRFALALAIAALTSPLLAAQARTPVPLAAGGAPVSELATEGDHTVALFAPTPSAGRLVARVADGRAVDFGSRVVVAESTPTNAITGGRVRLLDGIAWFQWLETPNGGFTSACFRTLDLETGALGPKASIDLAGDAILFPVDWMVTEEAGTPRLYLAYRRFDPPHDLVVVGSTDGGGTWTQTELVLGAAFFTGLGVFAAGDVVHALWVASAGLGKQLVYRRSTDAGQSFAPAIVVPGAELGDGYQVDLDGDLLAIAYRNFEPIGGTLSSTVGVVTSRDGGATFEAPSFVGSPIPVPFVLDENHDTPRIAIARGTQRVVALQRTWDELGGSWLFARVSNDGGATWSADTALVAETDVRQVAITPSNAGRDRVAISWIENDAQRTLRTALSFDGGASFGSAFDLADFSVAAFSAVWNERYENAVMRILEFDPGVNPPFGGAGDAYAGGFRPQSITPVGLASGSSAFSCEFAGFDGGADLAWFAFSTADGALPLPDGRALGVGSSAVLGKSLGLALGGPLSASLDPSGAGATATVDIAPASLPGVPLHAVGVSFDLDTMSFVDVSDVVVSGP